MAALLPHAAVVDAAGLAADQPAFEQHGAQAPLGQVQGRRAADAAAAEDEHIGIGHGVAATGRGMGFTGIWPRSRPASSSEQPRARASTAAPAGPQTRPWQRPMPRRE